MIVTKRSRSKKLGKGNRYVALLVCMHMQKSKFLRLRMKMTTTSYLFILYITHQIYLRDLEKKKNTNKTREHTATYRVTDRADENRTTQS